MTVKKDLRLFSQRDAENLQKFGYKQELKRTMGGFSSFAISFSLISVLTGIYANFNFGFSQIGGAIVWSWLLVGLGQFMVALVMADLSNHFPISGYGYQWASRLINPHIGFFVGWFLLIQFITGFPGTSQALAVTLSTLTGGETYGWTVSLITLFIISLVTLIHLYGIRLVSFVNDLGVYFELAGVTVLILALGFVWMAAGFVNTENLFNSVNVISKNSGGFSAFALSLLLGAWCMTGFEAAADMAEETYSPQKHVPKAVILSQLSAAISGFILLVLLVLMAGDIGEMQDKDNALISILVNALGTRITVALVIVIMISIFACAVASMATATRLLFSMCRDKILPFSHYLSIVNEKRQTPQAATLLIWLGSAIIIIMFRRIEIITSVGALAAYLGYSGIMYSALASKKNLNNQDGFTLGKWRKPVQGISLIWTLTVVAALSFPETEIPGISFKHLPLIMALLFTFVGILIYILYVKKRIVRGISGPPVS
jgi:amino acid transporter